MRLIIGVLFLITSYFPSQGLGKSIHFKIKAKQLIKEKKYKQASEILKSHTDLLDTHWLRVLASLYKKLGQSNLEIDSFQRIWKKKPLDPTAICELAWAQSAFFQSQDLEKLKETNTWNLKIWNKNMHDIISALRKCVKAQPKNKRSHTELLSIFIHKNTKNNFEALLVIKDITERFEMNKKLQSQTCRIYTEDNYFQRAKEACQKAIKIDKENTSNYVHLITILKKESKLLEAKKLILYTAQLFPKNKDILVSAAMAEEKDQKFSQALLFWKKIVDIDDKYAEGYKKIANILFKEKKYKEAMKLYLQACKLDKSLRDDFRQASNQLKLAGHSKLSQEYQYHTHKCWPEKTNLLDKLDKNQKSE